VVEQSGEDTATLPESEAESMPDQINAGSMLDEMNAGSMPDSEAESMLDQMLAHPGNEADARTLAEIGAQLPADAEHNQVWTQTKYTNIPSRGERESATTVQSPFYSLGISGQVDILATMRFFRYPLLDVISHADEFSHKLYPFRANATFAFLV
jgi:hypothetical protein